MAIPNLPILMPELDFATMENEESFHDDIDVSRKLLTSRYTKDFKRLRQS